MARRFGTKQKSEHAGEVRQSQLISTFGVGAIVDFVHDTVIIGGVDDWDNVPNWEERRLFNNNLQLIADVDYFLAPKTTNNTYFAQSHDVESYIFPRKLYCPVCKHIIDAQELGNQQKKHNCFMPRDKTPEKQCGGRLVASRFVLICANGHIEDFPYSWWVHNGKDCGKSNKPRIKMYNVDNRSDIDSLWIECEECNARRRMAPAFSENIFSGAYRCNGRHPHLGSEYVSECDGVLKTRLRTSSSVYFPVVLSALTIPPWSRKAVQMIEAEYERLVDKEQYGEEAISSHIQKWILPKTKSLTLPVLLAAYRLVKERKDSSKIRTEADAYAAEYEVLCKGTISDDEYVASAAEIPLSFKNIFDSITIVDKLTVINTLIGFTRIDSWNGALGGNNRLAPLSREKKRWFPAVKMLGEGIFFEFNDKTLTRWEQSVDKRYQRMAKELEVSGLDNKKFSPRYVALHTFAHLLIRQLADECGYSVSSIKEKIYCTFVDNPDKLDMRGVLLYLATSDAEGSLGGLISIASDPNRMQTILQNMLHKASWCSADPLCYNSTQQGFHSLNYAACHDCVLLPETSCEFRNVLLDRIAIVGMPEKPELGLMGQNLFSDVN